MNPTRENQNHFQGLPEFHYAALLGKTELLQKLLSTGNTILASVDLYGRTALHIAASHDVYKSLEVLCRSCSKDKKILDQKDNYGYTALHYAVQGANTYSAKLLLDSGCDVNPTQFSQYTPLHLAASYGYPELVAVLCNHGANVHARSATQETPLQMAARSGIRIRERMKVHYTTLALLLKFGSDANVRDNDGVTPLHYVAMYCENKECAALLCVAGASVRNCNPGKVTAVHVARRAEVHNFLKQLETIPLRLEHLCLLVLRQGLGTNFKDKTEYLPLPKPLKDKLLFKKLPRIV